MPTNTVLVVEDDGKVRTLLRNLLEDDGFCVIEARSTQEAEQALAHYSVSLVTLDLNLGNESGLEFARHVRRSSRVPIIIVTGKNDVVDRIVGLELGADDYITKPFHVREVLARVHSVLRRFSPAPKETVDPDGAASALLAVGMRFHFDGMTAIPERLELIDRNGVDCPLTSGDFKLLTIFLERPNRVLSRDQLMDLNNGKLHSPFDRTVDNQIARLRKRIERDPSDPKLIKTVRGVGYMLACDVQQVSSSSRSVQSC